MKPMIVVMVLILVIGISTIINQRFARADQRYDELVKTYECYPWPCTADFNSNGTTDRLDIIGDPRDRFMAFMVVRDGNRELFRYPYASIDGTFRTHSAIRIDSDGVRLLIFDGTSGPRHHFNQVYRWNGERIVEIAPSSLDREILSAMAAHDDAGSFHQWMLYRGLRNLYFSVLTIIAVGVMLYFGILSVRRH